MSTTKPRGRPSSDAARRAVLAAASQLLFEGGYEGLTVEGIATRAGVGRQTVYRWWSSKQAIVAEAVREGELGLEPIGIPDTGDLGADLRTWLRTYFGAMRTPQQAAIVRALAAAASTDAAEAVALSRHFTGPDHVQLVRRLQSAVVVGQARPEIDADAVADVFAGAAFYRVIARRDVSDDIADIVVDAVARGISVPPVSS